MNAAQAFRGKALAALTIRSASMRCRYWTQSITWASQSMASVHGCGGHLTSATLDVIAKPQIDVWEIRICLRRRPVATKGRS